MVLKIGQRSQNFISAYEGVSKRTKEVTLTLAAGTNLSNLSTVRAQGTIEADSDDNWYLDANLCFNADIATGTAFVFSISNIIFDTICKQVGEAYIDNTNYRAGGNITCDTSQDSNSNVVVEWQTSVTGETNKRVYVKLPRVKLASEPLTYTTAAKLESRDPSQYLNEASDTVVGLVGTGAQTFGGVKTFDAGLDLGQGTVLALDSGTYTPAAGSSAGNMTSNSFGAASYLHLGDVVTVSGLVSINPTASPGSATFFDMDLPIDPDSNFTLTSQAAGMAVVQDGNQTNNLFAIYPETGSKKVYFNATSASHTGSKEYMFHFTYRLR